MSNYGSERSPLDLSHQDVLPASQYLQERLQERRARSTRPKRARHTDFGPQPGRDDDIFLDEAETHRQARRFDSSPVLPSARVSDLGHSNSSGRRRALGTRDLDDQLDRLNKQNFALKLEIDHRRDHTHKLQGELNAMREQVERAERMEEEHAELLRINSQLVEELEKRDKAVEEAMDIICDLEERVHYVEEADSVTRPSTAHADSGYAGTELHDQDSPTNKFNAHARTPQIKLREPSLPASAASQKLQGLLIDQTPVRPKRRPNILSQQKPSTQALRSVFLENARELHPVKSFQSLLSRQESRLDDEADDTLSSPRLSVLSESSFPSIYSPKQNVSPDHFAWENTAEEDYHASPTRSPLHPRQDSIKRVSQWMSEHNADSLTPSKSNTISKPLQQDAETCMPPPSIPRPVAPESHYQSLNDALAAVSMKPSIISGDRSSSGESHDKLKRRPHHGLPRHFGHAGMSHGEPLLPPTPDSVSTRMLRNSRSSILDGRSLLDLTPAPVKGFDALEPGLRTAPKQMRSSVELRTAFASNLQHRDQAPEVPDFDVSSDDEEYGDVDRLSGGVLDFGIEYDCPDGKSIKMGTPSRFLKGSQSPPNFDGTSMTPHDEIFSPLRKRQSSENISWSAPAKPRLSRVETSPTIFSTFGRMVSGGGKVQTAAESVRSPRSAHSGSSGNRTVVPSDQQQEMRQTSPDVAQDRLRLHSDVVSPNRSRASPSPGRSLGLRTQRLFRRMSSSHGSDRGQSPLPTLTTTPSSAYADTTPIETRNKTAPGTPRSPSAAGQDRVEKEKRSLFGRSDSVKTADKARPATSMETRRRGSIRDVTTDNGHTFDMSTTDLNENSTSVMRETQEAIHPTLDLGIFQLPAPILPVFASAAFLYYKITNRQPAQIRPPWRHPPPQAMKVTGILTSTFYLTTFIYMATSTILSPTQNLAVTALATAHVFALTVLEAWLARTVIPPRAIAAAGWMCLVIDSFSPRSTERTIAAVVLSLPAACELSVGRDSGLSMSGALLLIIALRDVLPEQLVETGWWVAVPICSVLGSPYVTAYLNRWRTVRWMFAIVDDMLQEIGYVFAGLELLVVGCATSGFACSCLAWWWVIFDGRTSPPLSSTGASFVFGFCVYSPVWSLLVLLSRRGGVGNGGDREERLQRSLHTCVEATGWTIVFCSGLWLALLFMKAVGY
ncbi:uncharacterized protein MYCGRDRAFT_108644 [Zymoseptoria tritici IPO323]|uniref:Centrosomin N-terminal motif 1 domain-containing protein n=1 Tax=Zymoseptoria tritici (strain CBS 115943 / IPO323) TaxID=336722 RepID=F9X5R0_ZYMTI|nr:uncharacterized protein MYCGRDRAFT_108644 [Zymoseptoria tritici IPO323]EGP88842.1 hypothetical protein MYCGRDRAFT_108644 [Zymoseptoria tritici IPO323]